MSHAPLNLQERFPRRRTIDRQAGWGGIVEVLALEHRGILSLLDTLEDLAACLAKGRIPDYALILDVLDYLQHYPDRYHHPREDRLFGHLLARDESRREAMARVQREHGLLAGQNSSLFRQFTLIVQGRPADRPELERLVAAYIALYRRHLDYESTQIFPHAVGTPSVQDWRQLRSAMRFVDDPLFGDAVARRYHRLVRTLRTRREMRSESAAAGDE